MSSLMSAGFKGTVFWEFGVNLDNNVISLTKFANESFFSNVTAISAAIRFIVIRSHKLT
jgi:hypothetical protein